MKKIFLTICALLVLAALTGCSKSGTSAPDAVSSSVPSMPSQQESSTQSSVESSTQSSHTLTPEENEEALKVLEEVLAHLDTSSLKGFTESFSDKSNPDYISNSYFSLVGGFIVGEKVCMYHENEEYIFAFKASYVAREGEQGIMLLPIVIEDGTPKVLLDDAVMQKASAIISHYICPVCWGTGKKGDSGKCSQCDGFGYILHEKEDTELTKEII